MIRQCLRMHLTNAGFSVVGEASDGLEAVRLAQQVHPQIAILDFGMPSLNGIDAAREILKCSPSTKPILLTAYTEDQYVISALRAGILGYVLKSKAIEDLMVALTEVEQGNVYLS